MSGRENSEAGVIANGPALEELQDVQSLARLLREGAWGELAEKLESKRTTRALTGTERMHLGIARANLGRARQVGDVVTPDDLKDESHRDLFRRVAVAVAMREDRLGDAEVLAQLLVAARPDDSKDLALLDKIRMRSRTTGEGEAQARLLREGAWAELAERIEAKRKTHALTGMERINLGIALANLGRAQQVAEVVTLDDLRDEAHHDLFRRIAVAAAMREERHGDVELLVRLLLAARPDDPRDLEFLDKILLRSRKAEGEGRQAQAKLLRDGAWPELAERIEAKRSAGGLTAMDRVQLGIALANSGRAAEVDDVITLDDLRDEDHRDLFRRMAAAVAMREQRLGDAERCVRLLLSACPDDPKDSEFLDKILLRSRRGAEIEARTHAANTRVHPRKRADEGEGPSQGRLLRSGAWAELAELLESKQDRSDLTDSDRVQLGIALANLGQVERVAEVVTLEALKNETNRDLFRRIAVAAAMRGGRYEDAEALVRLLLAAHGSDARDLELLGRILLRTGKIAEGEATLEEAGAQGSDGSQQLARRIMVRLRSNEVTEAAELARQCLGRAHELPRLAQICLMALARAGDAAAAAPILDHLVKIDEIDARTAYEGAQVYLELYRPKEALALCEKALASGDTSLRLHLSAAQALIALNAPKEEVLRHLTSAHAESSEDPAVLTLFGEYLLQLGRYEDAVPVLKRALDVDPKARKTRLLYGRALRFARRYDEAADVFADGGDPATQTHSWKRQRTAALLQAGRKKEAAEVYAEFLGERRAKLAGEFAAHLEQLRKKPDISVIPRVRLDWAWNVASRIKGGDPLPDRAEWDRKAAWGLQADWAILDWLECRPHDIGQVVSMLDYNGPGVQRCRDLLKLGKGLLIASAHLGPMYAGPVVLKAGKVPFKVVASTPRVSSADYIDSLISTIDQTEVAVARQVFAALKSGVAVIIAIDGAMNPAADRVTWEGAAVTYSSFISELAYRQKCPSVFAQPFWKGNRIEFEVKQMPDPKPKETQEQFVARWRDAFFEELRAFFKLSPENLRLTGGLWRHIATAAEAED